MSHALLILLSALLLPSPSETTSPSHRTRLTRSGIQWERTVAPPLTPPMSRVNARAGERWRDSAVSHQQRWTPYEVSIGDAGAGVVAGKEVDDVGMSFYAGGSPDMVYDQPRDAWGHRVSMAEDSSTTAVLVIRSYGSSGVDAVLEVYDDWHEGVLRFSHTFPFSSLALGGGVDVNRDGSVILAWWASEEAGVTFFDAFRSDGTPISSGTLSDFSLARNGELDAAGDRAFVLGLNDAVVWNVDTGQPEARLTVHSIYDSFAISADGQRAAVSGRGFYRVFQRDPGGTWQSIARRDFANDFSISFLALDWNGRRIAWMRQFPTMDEFEIGLDEVGGLELFRHAYSAPDTSLQLVGYGVDLDDAGDTVAGVSWGDSDHLTPEGFVLDASGRVLREIHTDGSAFVGELTPDGELFVVGTKGTHANVFGAGGSVILVERIDPSLHVLGRPQPGDTLSLSLAEADPSAPVWLGVALGLNGQLQGPRLDLATLVTILGPYLVPPGGLSWTTTLPADPSLAGLMLHTQGFRFGPAGLEVTNKVSVRVML